MRYPYFFYPPEADNGLNLRRLGRYMAFIDTLLLCGGWVLFGAASGL